MACCEAGQKAKLVRQEMQTEESTKLQERFNTLAMHLFSQFPNIDLRLQLQEGSCIARCLLPEYSDDALELELDLEDPETTVREAIFSIKEVASLFDS